MIPMCLGNIFQQLYNLADSIIAGQFIGCGCIGGDRRDGISHVFRDRLAQWPGEWFCYSGSAEFWREKPEQIVAFCGNISCLMGVFAVIMTIDSK